MTMGDGRTLPLIFPIVEIHGSFMVFLLGAKSELLMLPDLASEDP